MRSFNKLMISMIFLISTASFANAEINNERMVRTDDPLKLRQLLLVYPSVVKKDIPQACKSMVVKYLILDDQESNQGSLFPEELEADMLQRIRKLTGYEINIRGLAYKGPKDIFELEYAVNDLVYAQIRGAYVYNASAKKCEITMTFVDIVN